MEVKNLYAVDNIISIFCLAAKKTLEKSTKQVIKYSATIQRIPKIALRPDIGCFVQFTGDYSGLVVMNFSVDAAYELYRSYMLTMGLSEKELVKDGHSNEVVDTMGEMTNQILGRSVSMVENQFDLNAYFGQPKALFLNSAITLTLEAVSSVNMAPDATFSENRRIVFKVGTHRFHMEISMEKTEFITYS